MPWKNGGGVTREMQREPAGAPTFDWRLSLATVDSSGPFSPFDGYTRTLVLVEGAGLDLSFGEHGGARLVSAGQMVSFDGGWPTRCELVEGRTTDLNLIVATGRVAAKSRCARLGQDEVVPTEPGSDRLICSIAGELQLTNTTGAVARLGRLDLARCLPGDGAITCRPLAAAGAVVFIATLSWPRPGGELR